MNPHQKPIEVRLLGPHDVVLGRGNRPNASLGSVRFRESIRVIIENGGIRKLDGHTEHEMARLIVARIKGIGGKFVKKLGIETANGLSDRMEYEEVCDAVACEKVTQCIRHQLRRYLCPRAANKSTSLTIIKANAKAWVPHLEVNATLGSSTPLRESSQQAPRLPARPPAASLSGMSSQPDDVPNHQKRSLRGGSSCVYSFVGSHHHIQPPVAIRTADSQACLQENHLATSLLPNLISRRDHVAWTTPSSILADDRGAILQLLQRQETALLHDAFMKSRTKKKIL